jgi:hypothetical protein
VAIYVVEDGIYCTRPYYRITLDLEDHDDTLVQQRRFGRQQFQFRQQLGQRHRQQLRQRQQRQQLHNDNYNDGLDSRGEINKCHMGNKSIKDAKT